MGTAPLPPRSVFIPSCPPWIQQPGSCSSRRGSGSAGGAPGAVPAGARPGRVPEPPVPAAVYRDRRCRVPRRKQRFPGEHSWIYGVFLAVPALGHPKGAAPAAPGVHPPPRQSPRCVLGPEHPVLGGKAVSGKVSPRFPSTPGSEGLIAHPLPKFPPADPAERGEPSVPHSAPAPSPLPAMRGDRGGVPALLGKTGTTGRCWQEKQGLIQTCRHVPSAPRRGAQPRQRAPPEPPKWQENPPRLPKKPPGGMRGTSHW